MVSTTSNGESPSVRINEKGLARILLTTNPGRCHTSPTMDAIVSGPTEHYHAPKPDLVPVLELKNKIKSRATETEEPSNTILHSTMRSFPLDAAGQLPQSETLWRTICRHHQGPLTNFNNQLPDHLKQTDRGKNFCWSKKPLFPIEIWNVYDRTVVNLPRSNNSIEGWQNAFARLVAIVHPSITKLTEKIRREQSKFEVDIAQICQG
ncbi:unnamed protein product [Rotaria socialis]|uniref:Uncharacterized protein n=3 Tax=Rotaria socialis TaxID=392032 RepID=A0A817WKW2_9BILA|nr:unnamed protein product [Rotaria socialis]